MKALIRQSPLLLVALLGLSLLDCREREPTEPEVQPVTSVQTDAATVDGAGVPTLTATELLQDPALNVFLGALTSPNSAEKIRRAMDAVVAEIESGDAARARDHFDDARKAVADYGRGGELDPDDDVHLDVIDFFLDGVEEMLPEVDEGPPKGKKKGT
jgi:hypothetical protein